MNAQSGANLPTSAQPPQHPHQGQITRQRIFETLRNKPTPPGWQSTFRLDKRASCIEQILSQLSLLKPDFTAQKVLDVAITFEAREFNNSPDEHTYTQACYKKFQEINQTRQNQANIQTQRAMNPNMQGLNPQQQAMYQQGMMNQPAQLQQQFQMNQMTQAQQIARHQQMQQMAQAGRMQGMNQGQVPPNNMLQQPQQPQQPPQQQQQQQAQPPQNTQQAQPPINVASLSAEEKAMIARKMQEIAISMTNEQKEEIARKTAMMPQQAKAQMDARGTNPLQFWAQNEAMRQFRAWKARQSMQQQGPGPAMPNGMQQGVQIPQGVFSQAPAGQQPNQMFGPGNISQQAIAQQQEALRRQQAGQQVVPGNTAQQNPAGGQQASQQPQQPQQQVQGPNNAWQGQVQGAFQQQNQSLWNSAQRQQTPQGQGQQQFTPQMLATNSQQQHLRGQMGGLNGNVNGGPGQRTPAMPTLNQPMEPPGQSHTGPSPRQGQVNPQQPNQAVHAATSQPPVGPQQNNVQRPKQFPEWIQNLPPEQKQQLQNMPSDEDRRQYLVRLVQQRQMANANRVGPTGPPANQTQQQPQQRPQAQVPPQQQQPSNTTSGPNGYQNMQGNANSQQTPSRQMQGMTAGQPNAQALQQQAPLNQQQMMFMDEMDFPPGIRQSHPTFNQMPTNARTWGQLKLFAAQNEHALPPNFVPILNGQQSKAFHFRQQQQRAQHMNGAGPQAPTAPMMAGSSQAPVAQMNPAAGGPSQLTAKQIQHVRASNPSAAHLSDDEIRKAIMTRQKQMQVNNTGQSNQNLAQQQQQHQLQQQNQYNQMIRAQQLQHNQQRQGQVQAPNSTAQAPSLPQQPQQQQAGSGGQTAPKAPQANMNQAKATTKANQKGNVKRANTSDDVVEIADPKLFKTAAAANKPGHTAPTSTSMPQFTNQQIASMSEQQKTQYLAQQPQPQRQQPGVPASQPSQTPQQAKPIDPQRMALLSKRVAELMAQVQSSMPPRKAQPMNAKTRMSMTQKLQENQKLLIQSRNGMALYLSTFNNEAKVKELARLYLLLQEQSRDTAGTPVENFTVTAAELDEILNTLKRTFGELMARLHQATAGQRNQPATANQNNQARQPNQNVQANQTPINNQPQPLTVESLNKQQEAIQKSRAAKLQNSQGDNKPPAAPTASQPPFQLGTGHQSPQGVPIFYNSSQTLTQEQLKMPPRKKVKANQPGAPGTPTQTGQPIQQASPPTKIESPKAQRAPPPPKFKCNVEACTQKTAFDSPAELEKHMAEAHPPKDEEIKDPLAFCLEGFRQVLNLDDQGKSKPVEQPSVPQPQAQAQVMKKSVSGQGHNIKAEASTPMSRNPTGTGPSPSSSHLKTPQTQNNVKTPASETKSATGAGAAARSKTNEPVVSEPDPWANAKVPANWFRNVFSSVSDLNRPVSEDDFLVDWLQAHPFQMHDPNLPDFEIAERSPHESDISSGVELNIDLNTGSPVQSREAMDSKGNSTASWVPADFSTSEQDLETILMDPILEMDWDTAFPTPPEEVKESSPRTRKREDEEYEVVSDEFLKIYAPKELEERKARARARK